MTDKNVQTGAENVVWDLSIFYSAIDDPQLDADIKTGLANAEAFAAQYRGRIAALSAAELAEAMTAYEALLDAHGRIGSFVSLMYTTDTNNAAYGARYQEVTEYDAKIQQTLLFLELEWNRIDNAVAEALLADPALSRYRHYLEAIRRYQPYQLSDEQEQLLVDTGVTGNQAWVRFFTQLTSALSYEWEGEQLTQSLVLAKLYNPDRDVRRRAADSVTATLRENTMPLTYVFNVLGADKAADDRRRGYPSWISARNLSNKAQDSTVEALIDAVTSRYDLVARHYRLKRALVGVDELYDYDRYAPIPSAATTRTYTWDEARQIVQSAYSAFSPELGALVARFFDERWIHAALAPGKRGGAFSASTVPSAHPFILVNFTGSANDVMTLAHELGHGVHQYLSGQAQGYIGAYMPLTTQEMASVFGEMLVFQDLMRNETDPAIQLAMLSQKVEDTFATVYRQISMNRFEDAFHNARRTKGELTTEQISEMWYETQKAMFGDSVTLRDEYKLWWSYIPHFIHTPGYVYAYSFGELLVLALFNVYQQRGEAFVPQYLDVLTRGDTDYPEALLSAVGVDLADPQFWHQGIDALEALIAQEEALAPVVYPDRVGK